MINGKTFYQVLGVLEDAEQVVIRAAYRALSQKYHPDKVQNEMASGSPRMADINRAYDTLSDPAKRAEYDAYLSSIGGKDDTSQLNDDAEDGIDDHSFDEAWEIAKEFYPKIESEYNRLKKTNKKLAFAFKAILLDHKIYEMSGEIAEKLETGFLKQYFGEDPEILEFARQLIHSGNRERAKELNKIVSIMGKSVSLGQIKKTFVTNWDEAADPAGGEVKVKTTLHRIKDEDNDKSYVLSIITTVAVVLLILLILIGR